MAAESIWKGYCNPQKVKTAFVPFTGIKQSMHNMYILVHFVRRAYRIKSEKAIFWLISVV